MNGKQSKKLRNMARLLNQAIPEHPDGRTKKSVDEIYQGLKKFIKQY